MNRGEIWTLRDTQYASKARPVVIIQTDCSRRQKMLGERVGTLSSNEMKKISKQLIIILGLGK